MHSSGLGFYKRLLGHELDQIKNEVVCVAFNIEKQYGQPSVGDDSIPYLVQSGQDMRMIEQNAVEGAIDTIIDVVHQGSVIGPILFFCSSRKTMKIKTENQAQQHISNQLYFSLSSHHQRLTAPS